MDLETSLVELLPRPNRLRRLGGIPTVGAREPSRHDANLVASRSTGGIPPHADGSGTVGRDALNMQRSGMPPGRQRILGLRATSRSRRALPPGEVVHIHDTVHRKSGWLPQPLARQTSQQTGQLRRAVKPSERHPEFAGQRFDLDRRCHQHHRARRRRQPAVAQPHGVGPHIFDAADLQRQADHLLKAPLHRLTMDVGMPHRGPAAQAGAGQDRKQHEKRAHQPNPYCRPFDEHPCSLPDLFPARNRIASRDPPV